MLSRPPWGKGSLPPAFQLVGAVWAQRPPLPSLGGENPVPRALALSPLPGGAPGSPAASEGLNGPGQAFRGLVDPKPPRAAACRRQPRGPLAPRERVDQVVAPAPQPRPRAWVHQQHPQPPDSVSSSGRPSPAAPGPARGAQPPRPTPLPVHRAHGALETAGAGIPARRRRVVGGWTHRGRKAPVRHGPVPGPHHWPTGPHAAPPAAGEQGCESSSGEIRGYTPQPQGRGPGHCPKTPMFPHFLHVYPLTSGARNGILDTSEHGSGPGR